MARSPRSQALAAGTDRLSRGRRADQSAAHFGGHEVVSVVGDRQRANPKRDAVCRADTVAAAAALQQKREPDDRKAVPHPLDFGRAFREEAGAFGSEGKPRARVGGDPATERYLEMSPMWRHGRSSHHGKPRPNVSTMYRSRRP